MYDDDDYARKKEEEKIKKGEKAERSKRKKKKKDLSQFGILNDSKDHCGSNGQSLLVWAISQP